jgi:hypothetical protein
LQSCVRSGGRLLGQSAGAEGPLSLIDTFAASPKL